MTQFIARTSKAEYLKGRCEVCGLFTFDADTRGTFDVCEKCFWEDDEYHKNMNEPCGGPNGKLSVNQARKNYLKYGVCNKDMLPNTQGNV